MNSDSIINRVNKALRKVATPGLDTRQVYKRVVTKTGGDALIGRKGTVTYTDTLLDPQPIWERVARNIVGPRTYAEQVVTTSEMREANEYMFTFSPTAISIADLENKNLVLMLKDTVTAEIETFDITDSETVGVVGALVMLVAFAKSTKRPA